MTLTTDIGIAKRVEVRMVFSYLGEMNDAAGNPYPFMIGDAARYLQGVEDLLFLAAVNHWDRFEAEQESDTFAKPQTFIRNVHVRRISYNSPLEVVVWFFAGTAAATTATKRLVNLWTAFQTARIVTAKADVARAASDLLIASFNAPIPVSRETTTGYDRIASASEVLAGLGELEIEEEA